MVEREARLSTALIISERDLARAIYEGLSQADVHGGPFMSPIEDIDEGEVIVDGYFDLLAVAKYVLRRFR